MLQVSKREPLISLGRMSVAFIFRADRPSMPTKAERGISLVFAGLPRDFRYRFETVSSQCYRRSRFSEAYSREINEFQRNL